MTLKALLGVMLLLGFSLTTLAQDKIRLAIPTYPPFYTTGGQGLASEIIRAAYEQSGLAVEFINAPIKRGVRMLENGEIDGFGAANLAGQQINSERLTLAPLFEARAAWFYYRPNQFTAITLNEIENLKRYRIGVIVNSPYLELYHRHQLNIVEIESLGQLVKMTKHNRIDLFEATLLSGLVMIDEIYPEEWRDFTIIDREEFGMAIGFLRDAPRTALLKKKYQQGLAKIIRNGQLMQIMESYWGANNVPSYVMPGADSNIGNTIPTPSLELFFSQQRNPHGKIKGRTEH